MRKLSFFLAVVAAGTALADGNDTELVEQKSRNPWHLTIGPVVAPRVRVRVRGSQPVLPTAAKARAASGTSANAAADPSAGYVERQYVDGYVKPDEGTEDPDSMISGLTWDWGAKDVGAQYSNGRMEFHTDTTRWSESVSSSSFSSGSGFESERDILMGVEVMGGRTFFENETFDAALDAGFRFYGSGDLEATSRYGTSVTTTRNAYRAVDSYDASGWTDVPSGSYEGTPGGPGRILGATPTRREESSGSSSSTETYTYSDYTRLVYNIWELRLGPTMGWKVTDDLTIRGGVYGLLGLVDAKLKSDIASSDGSYRTRKSTCEALFGMAFGLSAQYNLTETLFLYASAEYDWWTDAVRVKTGSADATIRLSDFTASLGLGVEF